MLIDIVIDTNVISHANNPSCKYGKDSMRFLMKMLESKTSMCLDAKLKDGSPDQKSSRIMQEYRNTLSATHGLTYQFLVQMMQKNRIKFVPTEVNRDDAVWINQRISVPNDRTILRIALNSEGFVVASNDYQDFTKSVRRECKKTFGLQVLESKDAILEL